MAKDEDPNFVSFGDVSRKQLGMQCQYGRHLLKEPGVGDGIRWQGRFEDYHGLTIHRDDVEEFVRRRAKGIIP